MEQTKTATKTSGMIAILMLGTFISILNQTLMTTALPYFMSDFNIASNTAQWLTTGFMLVNGIMIPITAFLVQRFSVRSLFFTAMSLLSLGTLLCGFAPSFGILLAGRMIQALGAGILMPLMQTVLFVVFPPEKRGVAMGIFGLVVAFAPAIGPTLSGLIVDQFQWRVLFYLLLPISLLILFISTFLVKNVTTTAKPKFDFLSVILSSLGFGGLLYGFSIAGSVGWTSPITLGIVILAALILVWFITRQSKLAEPMLDFHVFTYKLFTLPMLLVILVFVVFIAGMTILPIYMQTVLHYSALKSGLALMLGGIVMGVLSPFTGRIYDRWGARPLGIGGFVFVAISAFLLAKISTTTSFTYLTIAYMLMMVGEAAVMMPLTTAALNALPLSMISHGTAMNNTIRQISGAIGTAVLVTIMTSNSLDPAKYGTAAIVPGVQMTFMVVAGLSVLGLILAFTVQEVKK